MKKFKFYRTGLDSSNWICVFQGNETTKINLRGAIEPKRAGFEVCIWTNTTINGETVGTWQPICTLPTFNEAAQAAVNMLRIGLDTGIDVPESANDIIRVGDQVEVSLE